MTKRSLTDGEKTLAHSYYQDSIDYPKVRVSDKCIPFLKILGNMSIGGGLYLPTLYRPDFSQAIPAEQRLFIHEMVHVWQAQNNIVNLFVAGVCEFVKHRGDYDKAYLYRLERGKDLLDYGFEQQAAIIEEYFLRKNGTTWEKMPEAKGKPRCLNTEDNTQELLEGVLENFLKDPSYARRKKFLHPSLPRVHKLIPQMMVRAFLGS